MIARCKDCGRTGKVGEGRLCEGCSKPKKAERLDGVVGHLNAALTALGQDFATAEVRSLILAAIQRAGRVDAKRRRRASTPLQEYVAKAMTTHDRWWKQIEQNVREAAEKSLGKNENGATPQ